MVIVQSRVGKAVKPIGTVMSLRAKRSNLPKFGDCHVANAPRNDRASPRVTEAIQQMRNYFNFVITVNWH